MLKHLFKDNRVFFLNKCASLARWHRHICTLFDWILGMPRHKIMMPWQLNHTNVHLTCQSMCVEAQITIFKSRYLCQWASTAHSFRKKLDCTYVLSLHTCHSGTIYCESLACRVVFHFRVTTHASSWALHKQRWC